MADPFPTALQRTSDERWVTLEVVTRERGRLIARVEEEPGAVAVIRYGAKADYGQHLARLLEAAPPTPGPGIHLGWPDDMLHDLDAQIVGYLTLRPRSARTFPLGVYVDPASRNRIAPLATRRHHLRVARHVATAIAALHHAGNGRVRGRQFRIDEHANLVVVRTDELLPDAPRHVVVDDERRLGHLVQRLIGGRPWAETGELPRLLARVADRSRAPAPADEWFHALRAAERELPREHLAAATAEESGTRLATSIDLSTALATTRATATATASAATASAATATAEGARAVAREAAPVPEPAGGQTRPSPRIEPVTTSPSPTRIGASPARVPAPSRGEEVGQVARLVFTLSAGVVVGGLASVAPFAVFLAGATVLFTKAAVRIGDRKGTRGRTQKAVITASRLLPFTAGGLALAAFVLFDLLLVLGLVMAVAERLFDYGPGFTLTWILDLPEVPTLVRWFAFAVGAFSGLAVGGDIYDGLRSRAGGRRLIATPAIALAISLGLAIVDAGVVWWPLPAA